MVDGVLRELGTDVVMHGWPAAAVTPAALRALGGVPDLLVDDISVLDTKAVDLTLRVGADDATQTVGHRVLFDGRTFATYLIYWGAARPEPLRISLILPVEGTPGVHDLIANTRSGATGYAREQTTGRVEALAPLTGRPMLVDFNEGVEEVMAERAGVSAVRALSIGEIIARHQQQQRADRRLRDSPHADHERRPGVSKAADVDIALGVLDHQLRRQ